MNSNLNEDGDLTEVFHNDQIYFYYSNQTKIGYLRINSFSPNGTKEGFIDYVDKMVWTFDKLHKHNGTKLIIDVRSNKGGYSTLSSLTLQFISGNTIYPIFGSYDTRHSPIHDELFDAGLLDPINHLEYLTQKLEKKWYNPGLNRTFTSQIPTDNQKQNKNKNKNGDAFNHTYSNRYTVNIFENEKEFDSIYDRLKTSPSYALDQQHLLFLTDGLCEGSCSVFLKQAQEQHIGKIIGLGIDPSKKINSNGRVKQISQTAPYFDVGSSAGGQQSSSEYINEKKNLKSKKKWKSIPPPFPRYGSHVSWTVQEIFSYKNETKNTPLEFLVNPPDLIHQYFPDPVDEFEITRIQKLFNVITPAFDICAPWEVQKKSSCQPEGGIRMDFAVYGNPCDPTTQQFDDSQCVFSYCQYGYYLSPETGNCTIIPKEYQDHFVVTPILIIILVAFCVVSVIIIIIAVVLIVLLVQRFRRRSSYQPINGQF
ncbi:MAG: hypothetical protein EZS28_011349 [Streblomastix strix]|uniref:Tail specific protease domain-containing protein n=1 Tax=Streblomastix strix TaxID=222440 RepID=A0A5J4WFJ6_9EUKA|nr:MAG: hypothetical protein EZS28_011349 [Streblomastix strix]